MVLCLLAIKLNNKKFQAGRVIFFIAYKIVYIAGSMPYIGKYNGGMVEDGLQGFSKKDGRILLLFDFVQPWGTSFPGMRWGQLETGN
jgi:hypothetical protein